MSNSYTRPSILASHTYNNTYIQYIHSLPIPPIVYTIHHLIPQNTTYIVINNLVQPNNNLVHI